MDSQPSSWQLNLDHDPFPCGAALNITGVFVGAVGVSVVTGGAVVSLGTGAVTPGVIMLSCLAGGARRVISARGRTSTPFAGERLHAVRLINSRQKNHFISGFDVEKTLANIVAPEGWWMWWRLLA
jgi:hypothetical protein